MKIATWNLAGIKARMPVLLKWLEANSPDILVLQETKTVDEGFPRLEIEAMGYNIATLGQKSWNGVAILSKLPFDEVHRGLPGDDSDEQARLIEGVFSVEGGVVRVCGIYLPNGNPVKTDKFDYKLALDGPAAHLHRGAARSSRSRSSSSATSTSSRCRPMRRPRRPGSRTRCSSPRAGRAGARCINLGMVDAQRARHAMPGTTRSTTSRRSAGTGGTASGSTTSCCSPQAADRLQDVVVHTETRGWDKPSDHVPVEGDVRVLKSDAVTRRSPGERVIRSRRGETTELELEPAEPRAEGICHLQGRGALLGGGDRDGAVERGR